MPRIVRRALLTSLIALPLLSVWLQPCLFHGGFDDVRNRALRKLDSTARCINPRWDVRAWVPNGWMPLPTVHHCCDDIQYFPTYEEFLLPTHRSEPGEPYDPLQ